MKAPGWAIVIHGGAGTIERGNHSSEVETAYRTALSAALETGGAVLKSGRSALDAVESTIRAMEDDPLFNAGRGSVFSAVGRNELDASIMDGATLEAGAAAAVTRVRHPITLARAVMEKSRHVLLVGEGADSFAEKQGLELVDPSFFFTERRWQELERLMKERGDQIPPRPSGMHDSSGQLPDEQAYGTVGAVALDTAGNLAAGTSTGGRTGKLWGRIGDSPLIGAGTYASNQSCAVSGTGDGEYFIRLTIAREVCALIEYRCYSVQQAADEIIQRRLAALGGSGGVIAISPKGEMAWSFNTPGMYRAKMSSESAPTIGIFKDE